MILSDISFAYGAKAPYLDHLLNNLGAKFVYIRNCYVST